MQDDDTNNKITEVSKQPNAPEVADTPAQDKQEENNAEETETSEATQPQAEDNLTETPAPNEVEEKIEETTSEENTPTTTEEASADNASEASEETPEEKHETVPSAKPSDPKGTHWYVVHTYSGHEQKVAATLKQRVESQKLSDKILDILVPTQEKIEIKEGKKTNVKEKIFPGYLLIRMVLDDNTWLAVRTTPGITSFVGNANKPTPLPEDEVEGIKKFMAMEAPKFKTTFSVGEAVRITDGPFSEFLGSINEMDEEKGKLKVMVSIFGRETPVELDFLQVAKL